MNKVISVAVAVASLAVAVPAAAQTLRHDNNRISNMEHRINQGVRDGSLTWREARELRRRVNRARRVEYRYERHGVQRWERRALDRRLDRVSNEIWRQRHDNQYSYRRHYRWRR